METTIDMDLLVEVSVGKGWKGRKSGISGWQRWGRGRV